MTFWKTSTKRLKQAENNTSVDLGGSTTAEDQSLTDSVGIVETQTLTLDCIELENGASISPAQIAYETYGQPNSDKSNAILICHALSGDAHAAGYHKGDTAPGWWDAFIGPGKAFDTNKYWVICSNVLGGCMGSSGPSSINPTTGKPYGLSFPVITIADMVNAQAELVQYLGISKLMSVAGGSMGGMQALTWAVNYPELTRSVISIASPSSHSPQQIAFNEVGRQAIMADPRWNKGDYYDGEPPSGGLSVARMVGHITYMSDESLQRKFARKLQDKEQYDYHLDTEFQVESYLHHQGDKFVERFDANSYLYITRAIDYFDLSEKFGSLKRAFAYSKARFLFIAFKSDWLYPSKQVKELAAAAKSAQKEAVYFEIDSHHGHDSFLIKNNHQTYAINNFLLSEEARINED